MANDSNPEKFVLAYAGCPAEWRVKPEDLGQTMEPRQYTRAALIDLMDEGPAGRLQVPASVDAASWGAGVNSGWDAAIQEVIRWTFTPQHHPSAVATTPFTSRTSDNDLSSITQYDLVDFDIHGSGKIMEPTAGGDWVKWEDVARVSSRIGGLDQDTIDRVGAALETVDMGHSMSLTRLVDDVHTYTLTIRGEVETFVDNDDADAIDQVYARIREVKYRLQAEAVIAALNPTPQTRAEE